MSPFLRNVEDKIIVHLSQRWVWLVTYGMGRSKLSKIAKKLIGLCVKTSINYKRDVKRSRPCTYRFFFLKGVRTQLKCSL